MDDDNLTRQNDEIEALKCIYEKDFHIEDQNGRIYSIDIKEKDMESSLQINLPAHYPDKSPPKYTLSAPWLKGQSRLQLYTYLDNIYLENLGQCILYQWIERVREFMLDFKTETTVEPKIGEKNTEEATNEMALNNIKCPQVVSGEDIIDRRSVFQAHLARVSCVEEVQLALAELKGNKKIATATHNIYSYRFRNKNNVIVQEYEDDGEDRAGRRMMELLQIMDVEGALVVVTRWYGGIHLGPDRFKHINNAARIILTESGFSRVPTKGKKSSVK